VIEFFVFSSVDFQNYSSLEILFSNIFNKFNFIILLQNPNHSNGSGHGMKNYCIEDRKKSGNLTGEQFFSQNHESIL
jgi:hypothetical protein